MNGLNKPAVTPEDAVDYTLHQSHGMHMDNIGLKGVEHLSVGFENTKFMPVIKPQRVTFQFLL